jgi:hypothetical protein
MPRNPDGTIRAPTSRSSELVMATRLLARQKLPSGSAEGFTIETVSGPQGGACLYIGGSVVANPDGSVRAAWTTRGSE